MMLFHIQVMTALAYLINSNNAFEMTRGRWHKYATHIRTSSNILRVNNSSNRQENFFVSTNNNKKKKASRSQSGTINDRYIHSPIDTGTRLYYQSNDDQMDQHQHILNDDSKISLRDVRMGLLGKPAKTSEEDLELTRQIIMNQWDIELTRKTVMDITATTTPQAAVVGVKVEKETVPSKIETAESVSILSPMLEPLPAVSPKTIRRTSIRGVSVSPSGFLVLIMTQTGYSDGKTLLTETTESSDPLTGAGASTTIFQHMTLPIPITSNAQDTIAATTPESLTMCQLLTGIDMAGTIFNPEVLQNIVGIYCSPEEEFDYDNEDVDDDINTYEEYETEDKEAMEDVNMFVELSLLIEKMNEVLETSESDTTNIEEQSNETSGSTRHYIRTNLQSSLVEHNVLSYQEADPSQRASVSFPKITLDSITIDLPNFLEGQTQKKARALKKDSNDSDGNIDDKDYVENKELWKNIVLEDVQEKRPGQGQQEQDSPTTVPLPLQFTLECRVDGDKTLHVPIYTQISTIQRKYPHLYYDTNSKVEGSAMPMEMELCKEILQDVLYDYDGDCSGAFIAMALALRYNCPIGITSCAIAAITEVQHQLEKGDNLNCESGSRTTHTGSDCSNASCNGLHVCILKKTSSPSVSARTDTSMSSSNQERTLSQIRIHNECFDSEEEIDDNIDYDEDYIEDFVPYSHPERSKFGLTQGNSDDDDDDDIISILPDFKSLSSLRFQSQRIVQDIQLSFRLNQLQSALSIALEKEDDVAAERIKKAISKLMDTM